MLDRKTSLSFFSRFGFLLAGPGIEKPQPRPMKGILVAIIVMNCTLTSIGRLAM